MLKIMMLSALPVASILTGCGSDQETEPEMDEARESIREAAWESAEAGRAV